MAEATDNFLAHHGVKGQKWGVIRNGGSGGSGSAKKKAVRKTSGDANAAKRLKQKHLSELSNKQLKTLTERQGLEQRYKQLNPTAVSQGQKEAKAILAAAGTGIAVYNMYNSPAGKAAIGVGKTVVKSLLKRA